VVDNKLACLVLDRGGGAFVVGGTNETHVHGPGCKHGAGGHGHSHHHRCGIVGRICSTALHACTGGPMLQLLGLDRFTKGKAMTGMRKAGPGGAASNPFSMGVVGVCHFLSLVQPCLILVCRIVMTFGRTAERSG
jgi:hypothetical protein